MELTWLEQQLLAGVSEAQVAAWVLPLQQLQQQLQQQLTCPQRPATYAALQRQLQALIAAEQVITILAQRYRNDYRCYKE